MDDGDCGAWVDLGKNSCSVAGLDGTGRVAASAIASGEWLRGLIGRAHKNKVIVALAGKLARIAWAVLRSGESYVKEGRPVAA